MGGVIILTAMSSVQQVANTQVFVPPALNDQLLSTVTTNNGGTPSSGGDLVTINCDMLMQRQGQPPIKAIAWDEGNGSMSTYLYFEDPNGNQAFIQFKGIHPDIVLGDSRDKPGVDYRAAVVYLDQKFRAAINFYDLRNVGTPAFAVTPSGGPILLTGQTLGLPCCPPWPHIDMWSDASILINGYYPAMYEFAVTWEEQNDILYNWGHIAGALYNNSGLPVIPNGSLKNFTDVACYTNINNSRRYAAFCYNVWPNGLVVDELDFSVSPPGVTSHLSSTPVYSPRIEAMNQYDPTTIAAPWEVVASLNTSCRVFNSTTILSGTDISSSLLSGGNFKSMAIAAGAGNMPGEPVIGNIQFTPGYFEWNNMVAPPRYYSRAVDAFTGAVIDPNYYIINTQPVFGMPQYYLADVSQGLALSNCSNSGNYLLSVWYDGRDVAATGNIWYKLSGNATPMQFKTTAVAGLNGSASVKLYPTPATDILYLENATGIYTIYNFTGAKVSEGNLSQNNPVNIATLPSGMYLLKAGDKAFKFTKQ